VKTVTIEDPVEYQLPYMTQIPVNGEVTFARAMRASLRSDPDVMMIGDVRDRETMMMTIEAALTGHLVFTSMHTNSAASSLRMMLDAYGDAFMMSESVRAILNQRLVRCLCKSCKEEYELSSQEQSRLDDFCRGAGISSDELGSTFYRETGCDECAHGFRGRMPVNELMEMSNHLAGALTEDISMEDIHSRAIEDGMISMEADALYRAVEGETSLSEVYRVLANRM
jgi:type IV pilus assembly protein PilB